MVSGTTRIRTLREFSAGESPAAAARRGLRAAALFVLSASRRIGSSSGWIRFPYYHHVFDDERSGFERQLRYMRRFGDLISLDAAADLIEADEAIPGRFFCVTFDDGLANCYSNALPILSALGAPATIFLPTAMIDAASSGRDPAAAGRTPAAGAEPGRPVGYLTWGQCREMTSAGIGFGSHTVTHRRLADLSDDEVAQELRESRARIEGEIGGPCNHFCCPFGVEGRDYTPGREPAMAREGGYRSFLTGVRGPMQSQDSLFLVRRDHLMAGWGNYQLRYFLSRVPILGPAAVGEIRGPL